MSFQQYDEVPKPYEGDITATIYSVDVVTPGIYIENQVAISHSCLWKINAVDGLFGYAGDRRALVFTE